MDGRPTWTDCDEAGDYVVPNALSPRDLVFRPDNMDETVPHTENWHYGERSQTVKTEEDGWQLMMKRCLLRGTNVRYCKGVPGIIAIPRHQYSTWFIVVLNTELRPHLVVSDIIAIAEP